MAKRKSKTRLRFAQTNGDGFSCERRLFPWNYRRLLNYNPPCLLRSLPPFLKGGLLSPLRKGYCPPLPCHVERSRNVSFEILRQAQNNIWQPILCPPFFKGGFCLPCAKGIARPTLSRWAKSKRLFWDSSASSEWQLTTHIVSPFFSKGAFASLVQREVPPLPCHVERSRNVSFEILRQAQNDSWRPALCPPCAKGWAAHSTHMPVTCARAANWAIAHRLVQ